MFNIKHNIPTVTSDHKLGDSVSFYGILSKDGYYKRYSKKGDTIFHGYISHIVHGEFYCVKDLTNIPYERSFVDHELQPRCIFNN